MDVSEKSASLYNEDLFHRARRLAMTKSEHPQSDKHQIVEVVNNAFSAPGALLGSLSRDAKKAQISGPVSRLFARLTTQSDCPKHLAEAKFQIGYARLPHRWPFNVFLHSYELIKIGSQHLFPDSL